MINLSEKQRDVKSKIDKIAPMLGLDPIWATSIAMIESSLGVHQLSKTGCKGVFQMSTIAMKDLLKDMENIDDDLIDIICGLLFLRLLLNRWKDTKKATEHFCDPAEKKSYLQRVTNCMRIFSEKENL